MKEESEGGKEGRDEGWKKEKRRENQGYEWKEGREVRGDSELEVKRQCF